MLGYTDDIVSHDSLPARLGAFGWDCEEVDGHDVLAVQEALQRMKARSNHRPKALVARTVPYSFPFPPIPLAHFAGSMTLRTRATISSAVDSSIRSTNRAEPACTRAVRSKVRT